MFAVGYFELILMLDTESKIKVFLFFKNILFAMLEVSERNDFFRFRNYHGRTERRTNQTNRQKFFSAFRSINSENVILLKDYMENFSSYFKTQIITLHH